MTNHPFPAPLKIEKIWHENPRKYWEQILNLLIQQGFEIKYYYFAANQSEWFYTNRYLQIDAFHKEKGFCIDVMNDTYLLGKKVGDTKMKDLYRGTNDRTFILELMIALLSEMKL